MPDFAKRFRKEVTDKMEEETITINEAIKRLNQRKVWLAHQEVKIKMQRKTHTWLVVSLDVGDLGEWFFDTRKRALFFRKELIKTGVEPDNISLYYGKIILQECNLPSYKGSGWKPNKWIKL